MAREGRKVCVILKLRKRLIKLNTARAIGVTEKVEVRV